MARCCSFRAHAHAWVWGVCHAWVQAVHDPPYNPITHHRLQMLASSRAFVINQFGLSGGLPVYTSRARCLKSALLAALAAVQQLRWPQPLGAPAARVRVHQPLCTFACMHACLHPCPLPPPHPLLPAPQPLCGKTAPTGPAPSTSTCSPAPWRAWTSALCARQARCTPAGARWTLHLCSLCCGSLGHS